MNKLVGLVVALGIAGKTVAANLILYPVQTGSDTTAYRTGIPTLNVEPRTGQRLHLLLPLIPIFIPLQTTPVDD